MSPEAAHETVRSEHSPGIASVIPSPIEETALAIGAAAQEGPQYICIGLQI